MPRYGWRSAEGRHSFEPETHIPPMSLLLWHKMVAVRCFVWSLSLRLWSGRQAKIHDFLSGRLKLFSWLDGQPKTIP